MVRCAAYLRGAKISGTCRCSCSAVHLSGFDFSCKMRFENTEIKLPRVEVQSLYAFKYIFVVFHYSMPYLTHEATAWTLFLINQ